MIIADDHLQITGLSGVSDIITDLIVEEGISASELGLTETQAQRISRLSSAVNKHSHKTEKYKKELQTWMKTKRKERLAEYLQTLAEQRAKEHSPFPLRKQLTPGLSSRDIKLQQKKKDEKDNSFCGSCRTARSKVPAKADFCQTKSFSSLSSDITQRKGQVRQAPYRRISSEDYQGQMQWKSSRNQRQWSKSRLNLKSRASDRISRSVNQRRLPTTDIGIQANDESEDDAMSVWSVPGEIQQILYGSSNVTKESLLLEDACSTNFNNVDSVSESTSSILSKLDWKAVEALVANVEEK
ncbi:hypothetical protein JD844_008446 [Phrynosoma platyrhinos]|uniref:Uncharacterized protein n=1 Tax=Phrynosoma platyrhinos TaxID=52577 RepID=A0ABQ7TFF4_PHRPL|nr:hypothetical protein JD844_008446 [Phrynosoma platyrhinos]